MMVATAVSPAPAPQAAKAGADSAAPPGEGEGRFSSLLQLLGLAEPAQDATPASADPLAQAVLQALDDDAVATPDPQSPLTIPFMQPVDIKAAQLLVRQGQEEATAALLGLSAAPNALATLSAEDIARALQSVLGDAAADAGTDTPDAAQLLQATPLSQQTHDAASIQRSAVGESPARQLHAEVGTPAWSDELGARLQLMTEKGHHAASLRLSPEHLGPLEVQISVQDDQATVWFGAAHADTRAALEQALPRLRELFAAQGLSLSQGGVFQESARDPGRAAPELRSGSPIAEGAEAGTAVAVQASRRGLVDTYA